MSKVAGLETYVAIAESVSNRAFEPWEVARVLGTIDNVQTGRLGSVNIRDGMGCCWSIVLRLHNEYRVQLRSVNHDLLCQNRDTKSHSAQVRFHFASACESLYPTGRTLTLSPMDFISRWRSQRHTEDFHLVTSRLHRENIAKEFFGDFLKLSNMEDFSWLFAASGMLYYGSPRCGGYTSPEILIEKMGNLIPELLSVFLLCQAKKPA